MVPLKLRTIFFSSSQNSASLITRDVRAVIIPGFWLCLLTQIMSGIQNVTLFASYFTLFLEYFVNNNNPITSH